MTLIAIDKLKPNPWRDFEIYPLDEESIVSLVDSIGQHGFWNGIKARKAGDYYELGFGHHRIEAAKRSGLDKVDIVVDDISDDKMIQLMCKENSTQRGAVAGAINNEVAAATKRIASLVLSEEDIRSIDQKCPGLFESQKALESARGRVEHGDGVGRDLILRYLHKARSARQVMEAIEALKEDGTYPEILAEVDRQNAAQVAEAEAQQTSEPAPAPETIVRVTRARAARERSTRAREHSAQHNRRVFDRRCASVFDNEHQYTAFREAVTTETGRRFIAISEQYELAKKTKRELGGGGRAGRFGSPAIRSYVVSHIREAIAAQRQIARQEREQLERDNRRGALNAKLKDVMIHLTSAASGISKINEMVSEDHELANTSPLLGKFETKLDVLIDALREAKRRIQLSKRRRAA